MLFMMSGRCIGQETSTPYSTPTSTSPAWTTWVLLGRDRSSRGMRASCNGACICMVLDSLVLVLYCDSMAMEMEMAMPIASQLIRVVCCCIFGV